LTGTSEQLLGEIADAFTADWFEAAVKEAVEAGVRKLKYVKAILERWKVEGKSSDRGGNKSSGSAGSLSGAERCSVCGSKHWPACKEKVAT
jgi:DnaD/phage-associated family protein